MPCSTGRWKRRVFEFSFAGYKVTAKKFDSGFLFSKNLNKINSTA